MKRLNQENINTSELSEKIFETRWRKQLHYADFNRFLLLSKYFKGDKFLDLGVFNSPLPIDLKTKFPESEIWAIDHAPKVIEHLKELFPEINYVVGDVMKLPFQDESFDYLVAGELIEHLEDPTAFVKESFRVLRPGGYFALSTPFEEDLSQPIITPEHLWSFEEKDLRDLLESYGTLEITVFQEVIGSKIKVFIAYCQKFDRSSQQTFLHKSI